MCANNAQISLSKVLKKKESGKKEGDKRQSKCKKVDGGVRRTLSPALGVESSETGCVPWVRLESVVRCVT